MRRRAIGTVIVIGGLAAGMAQAHHSPAIFDQTREIELRGTVTEFEWASPHSWIRLDVISDQGFAENWSVEMGPPTYIVRGGWTETTVQTGDAVTIVANPIRSGLTTAKFVSITLSSGRRLTEQALALE